MAPSASKLSLRIRTSDRIITAEHFSSCIQKIIELTATRSPVNASIRHSLASYNGDSVGTITLGSPEIKAMVGSALPKITRTAGIDCVIDDTFDGLTTLHNPQDATIDVCSIHGLGGNAFDTFTTSTTMWLRDFLPAHELFARARIMTFGYNAALFDKRSADRLQDWADDLLRKLGDVRTTEVEQNRPLILICHSMGGIVGRKALIRLKELPNRFPGIQLAKVGVLYLSVPHYGSRQADWNKWIVMVAGTAGLRKSAVVDELRTLSSKMVDVTDSFGSMGEIPPFYCLCEGNKTSVLGKQVMIVEQASAGFLGKSAEKILGTDHSQICKFDDKLSRYRDVLRRLQNLYHDLLGSRPIPGEDITHLPGTPNNTAYRFPLKEGTKYYEGASLRLEQQLLGRGDVLEQLGNLLDKKDEYPQKIIACTGVGGIGKTEILLELAFQHRNVRNVFHIEAHSVETMRDQLFLVADSVGADILEHCPLSERNDLWQTLNPDRKRRALFDWLASETNANSLFLVDDVDGLLTDDAIQEALPKEARTIIYASRDPNLLSDLRRKGHLLQVSSMDRQELLILMKSFWQEAGPWGLELPAETTLLSIADVVSGHPLAACRAIAFIQQEFSLDTENCPFNDFVAAYHGPNWCSRRAFVNFQPRFGSSLMSTFEGSLSRLRNNRDMTLRMLNLMALLTGNDDLDFRAFFRKERPWLQEVAIHLPDLDLFMCGASVRSQCLRELVSTSILERRSNMRLTIPPIWLECIRQRMGQEVLGRLLRQIYLIILSSPYKDGQDGDVSEFMDTVIQVAQRFGVDKQQLMPTSETKLWLEKCEKKFSEKDPTLHQISDLRNRSHELSRSIEAHKGKIDRSKEKFASYRMDFIGILRELQTLDDRCILHEDDAVHRLHLQTYEILIFAAGFCDAYTCANLQKMKAKRFAVDPPNVVT